MSDHDPATCSEGDGGPCAECQERIENEGIEQLYTCPWCDRLQTTEQIRRCSGYQPQCSKEELCDAYSDPADAAKLEAMLKEQP